MSAGIWALQADLPALEGAARAWQRISDRLTEVSEGLASAGASAVADWTGPAAEQFGARRLAIVADLDLAAGYASSAASALTSAAASVRSTQGSLDTSWASVSGLPWGDVGGGAIEFQVATEAEQNAVDAAICAADDLRAALDGELVVQSDALTLASTGFAALVTAWEPVVSGSQAFVTGLPPVPDVGIRILNGEAVISTGDGDEWVTFSEDPATGGTIVTIQRLDSSGNLVDVGEYLIPEGVDITLRTGNGDDVVTLPTETGVRFTVVGGEGKDRITGSGGADRIIGGGGDDEVEAGAGVDYVSGGAGSDYVDGQQHGDWILGGSGNDALYGLGGLDRIGGGSGDDYLEGGEYADRLQGEGGDDVVSGGRGDDVTVGGAGVDVSYGGQGQDQVLGGSGGDTTYDDAPAAGSEAENPITIEVSIDTSQIQISGSDEFVARVQADLDMLAGSPAGREMLEALQAGSATGGILTIVEYNPPVGEYNNKAGPDYVRYMPSYHREDRPPVVGLFHELGHLHSEQLGLDDGSPYLGTDPVDGPVGSDTVGVEERRVVGLPIDHDNDPATPEIPDPAYPEATTENALRTELGYDPRPTYRR